MSTFACDDDPKDREINWDNKLDRILRQVYIDMGHDGLEEVLRLMRFFHNMHTLATKEMKRAYFNSDGFKETMKPFKETVRKLGW